ncbi:MAG TPA: hypothetical protein VHO84_00190 [Syntrophorhabdaceae bacterium]|nr:hypothetical protein [Syntrophorhabdaceae bacterium]
MTESKTFDLLWSFFPTFIFRGVLEKHFMKSIPRIADIDLSRLAYQWEISINRIIDEIRNQAVVPA